MFQGALLEWALRECGEMAAGADQINTAVDRVNTISIDNREHIGFLAGEVARFKVE